MYTSRICICNKRISVDAISVGVGSERSLAWRDCTIHISCAYSCRLLVVLVLPDTDVATVSLC